MHISPSYLKLYQDLDPDWNVSPSNPFIMERNRGTIMMETRPNWALIIPLAVILLAVLITVCVLLYRKWRRDNCYPIYFAGAVRYAKKGVPLKEAMRVKLWENSLVGVWNSDWLNNEIVAAKLPPNIALYTDAEFTKPLNREQIVTEPVYIFPKIEN